MEVGSQESPAPRERRRGQLYACLLSDTNETFKWNHLRRLRKYQMEAARQDQVLSGIDLGIALYRANETTGGREWKE